MVQWYKLVRLFLWISVFCCCALIFFTMYTLETESGPLLPQDQLPKIQTPKKLLPENQLPENQQLKQQLLEKQTEDLEESTYYTKVEVEAHPRYSLPYNLSVQGQAFPFSDAHLRHFKLDVVHTLTQVPDDIRDRLVLVTAASSGFYHGAMAVIAGTQWYFPNHTLLVYDLGGGGGLQQMVRDQVKGMPCQVQFRTFNFTKYPKHVKKLRNYSWKFLVIKEVLETHDALFWLDSSIKFKNTLPSSVNLRTSPIKLLAYSGHSNYAATHPGMYTFLPTDKEKQKKTLEYEANSMLIVNTRAAFESVLKWVYLCSLYEDCIAPKGASTGCNFRKEAFNKHDRHCHRFDQAAVNLLLSNSMDFDYPSYVFNNGDYKILMVKRGQRMSGVIKRCAG